MTDASGKKGKGGGDMFDILDFMSDSGAFSNGPFNYDKTTGILSVNEDWFKDDAHVKQEEDYVNWLKDNEYGDLVYTDANGKDRIGDLTRT